MGIYNNDRQRQEERERGVGVFLAGLVAGLAVALTINSFSVELQVEGGSCKYGAAKDGTFYQSDRLTDNDLSSGCAAIAIAGSFNERWGWRVAYMNLGTIRARDNHVTQWDEEAFRPLAQACDPATKHGCTAVMYGEGGNQGFLFSATYRWPFRYFDVLGEGGLFFFRSRFDAFAIKDEDGTRSDVHEESGYLKPPAPTLGLGVRKGPFYIIARKGWSLDHRALSLTDHSFTQVMAGIALEIN